MSWTLPAELLEKSCVSSLEKVEVRSPCLLLLLLRSACIGLPLSVSWRTTGAWQPKGERGPKTGSGTGSGTSGGRDPAAEEEEEEERPGPESLDWETRSAVGKVSGASRPGGRDLSCGCSSATWAGASLWCFSFASSFVWFRACCGVTFPKANFLRWSPVAVLLLALEKVLSSFLLTFAGCAGAGGSCSEGSRLRPKVVLGGGWVGRRGVVSCCAAGVGVIAGAGSAVVCFFLWTKWLFIGLGHTRPTSRFVLGLAGRFLGQAGVCLGWTWACTGQTCHRRPQSHFQRAADALFLQPLHHVSFHLALSMSFLTADDLALLQEGQAM